ncbi:hypothetical protein GCM10027563_20340 [Parasphingorhabdus pacifica]
MPLIPDGTRARRTLCARPRRCRKAGGLGPGRNTISPTRNQTEQPPGGRRSQVVTPDRDVPIVGHHNKPDRRPRRRRPQVQSGLDAVPGEHGTSKNVRGPVLTHSPPPTSAGPRIPTTPVP